MHNGQLIFRAGLLTCDRWLQDQGFRFKYYSTIAKLTNVWREMGGAFYDGFVRQYGPEHSRHVRGLPHKCVAGRWGSVHVTEAYYLRCGCDVVFRLVALVIGGVSDDDAAPLPDGIVAEVLMKVEDPSIEEQHSHRKRMGRWRYSVLKDVTSPERMFLRVMFLHHQVAGVMEHFMAFLSKKQTVEELALHGNKLAQLVVGRGVGFMNEYGDLLIKTGWLDSRIGSDTGAVLRDDRDPLLRLVVELVLKHGAGFQRRVVGPLSLFHA